MRSLADRLQRPNRWLMDQFGSRQRGQIMVMFAFGFVALVACLALVTDLGVLFTTRRSWQKIADTCAVVGAQSATASPRALACTVSNNVLDWRDGEQPAIEGPVHGEHRLRRSHYQSKCADDLHARARHPDRSDRGAGSRP